MTAWRLLFLPLGPPYVRYSVVYLFSGFPCPIVWVVLFLLCVFSDWISSVLCISRFMYSSIVEHFDAQRQWVIFSASLCTTLGSYFNISNA